MSGSLRIRALFVIFNSKRPIVTRKGLVSPFNYAALPLNLDKRTLRALRMFFLRAAVCAGVRLLPPFLPSIAAIVETTGSTVLMLTGVENIMNAHDTRIKIKNREKRTNHYSRNLPALLRAASGG